MTLAALARQATPTGAFEVIIVDDGSHDDTRDVVAAFRHDFPLRYLFQEDRGFRVAEARNIGVAAAVGDTLIFLDAGILPTSWLVAAHVAAQHRRPSALVGYVHGYDTSTAERPSELIPEGDVDACVARWQTLDGAEDCRELVYGRVEDRLDTQPAPWALFWTANVSVPRDEFAAVGGFDTDFRSWGVEDIEFAYRLHRRGLPIRLCRDAAALDAPHERDPVANEASHRRNAVLFYRKHPTPLVELFSVSAPCSVNAQWRALEELFATRRERLRRALPLRPWAAGEAVRAIGRGASLLVGCEDEALVRAWSGLAIEPDPGLLDRAHAWNRRLEVRHALGVRVPVADGRFEAALLSPQIVALPQEVVAMVAAEAGRVASRVYVLDRGDARKPPRPRLVHDLFASSRAADGLMPDASLWNLDRLATATE